MDFTDLSRLWWLLALPVVALLARPPRPRRDVATAHMAQWRAALAAIRRPPVRLRLLRLLLLLLAITALTLAATRPSLAAEPGPRRLVVLLDESASMAHGGGWDRARAVVASLVHEVPPSVEVVLVCCADEARVIRAAERDALVAAMPAAPRAVSLAIDLDAYAARVASAETQVCTITDGRDGAPQVGALRVVADGDANRAIVGCAIVDAWPRPAVAVDCELRAWGGAAADTRIEVRLGDAVLAEQAVEFVAGAARVRVEVERPPGGGDVWQELAVGVLGPSDGNPLDDRVRFLVPPLPAPDLAILAAPARRTAVLRAGAELLASLGGGEVLDSEVDEAGFVLADGGRIAALPRRGMLFGTAVADGGADEGPRQRPVVTEIARGDPLLEGLDLSELRVQSALPTAALPAGATTLVDSDVGPLLVAAERADGSRTLCAAFGLGESNLGLLTAFPQLLLRAYHAGFGPGAGPRPLPGNLLDDAESDPAHAAATDRPLAPFGTPARSLVVPALLLAFALLAARMLA